MVACGRGWRRRGFLKTLALLAAPTLTGCGPPDLGCVPSRAVVASGLTNPRGLAVSNGAIYVAEVGTKDRGGSVSRLSNGDKTPLVKGLPYFVDSIDEEVGAADVAVRRGELYVLQGESPGELGSALLRANGDSVEKVADFKAFEDRYNPDNGDRESNPFAMIYDASADVFYVVDSAANDLLRVHLNGQIEVVAVWMTGHPVPTGFARGPDGAFYVAMFSPAPYDAGSGRIDQVAPNGSITTAVAKLTTPIGVAFDSAGALYVLQFCRGYQKYRPVGFVPRTGRLLRVSDASMETIVEGLSFPTEVRAPGDGSFLISNNGALLAPGQGEILRVELCR